MLLKKKQTKEPHPPEGWKYLPCFAKWKARRQILTGGGEDGRGKGTYCGFYPDSLAASLKASFCPDGSAKAWQLFSLCPTRATVQSCHAWPCEWCFERDHLLTQPTAPAAGPQVSSVGSPCGPSSFILTLYACDRWSLSFPSHFSTTICRNVDSLHINTWL